MTRRPHERVHSEVTAHVARPRTFVLPVTSDHDGLEHLVADDAMTPGSGGRYVAICQRRVWAAVLASSSGPPCPACAAVRRAAAAVPRRTPQRGVMAQLATLLRRPDPGVVGLAAGPGNRPTATRAARHPDTGGIETEPRRAGPSGPDAPNQPAQQGQQPVMLARYRSGVTGQAARIVHLVPLPIGGGQRAANALCGQAVRPGEFEPVRPGSGAPCWLCLVNRQTGGPPRSPVAERTNPGPRADYRAWEWPVTWRGDQAWLSLGRDAVALVVPVSMANEIAAILATRRCPPPMLAHPEIPGHRVLFAGEPYPRALPRLPGVRRLTGTVLLPPTLAPRGPLSWVHPPRRDSLRLCREVDIAAAVRIAMSERTERAKAQQGVYGRPEHLWPQPAL